MTLPTNGTLKRIIAGVVAGVLLFMAGAVLGNRNSITAIEGRLETIDVTAKLGREQGTRDRNEILALIEKNCAKNDEQHKEIMAAIKDAKK